MTSLASLCLTADDYVREVALDAAIRLDKRVEPITLTAVVSTACAQISADVADGHVPPALTRDITSLAARGSDLRRAIQTELDHLVVNDELLLLGDQHYSLFLRPCA